MTDSVPTFTVLTDIQDGVEIQGEVPDGTYISSDDASKLYNLPSPGQLVVTSSNYIVSTPPAVTSGEALVVVSAESNPASISITPGAVVSTRH